MYACWFADDFSLSMECKIWCVLICLFYLLMVSLLGNRLFHSLCKNLFVYFWIFWSIWPIMYTHQTLISKKPFFSGGRDISKQAPTFSIVPIISYFVCSFAILFHIIKNHIFIVFFCAWNCCYLHKNESIFRDIGSEMSVSVTWPWIQLKLWWNWRACAILYDVRKWISSKPNHNE